MDSLRGNYGSLADGGGYDAADDDIAERTPPPAIGQDERRMQVRAYNHWASLLEDRNFPAIEDLEPDNLPDFGPYSVLLDFSSGIENPGISFLGAELAVECGVSNEDLTTLAEVPSRSLLTRITDHYMQILANQAPIGFEAEFVNQRGATIAYRGILLPFSSDDDTIDFIYGVINWKELADAQASDELLLEIDQVLEPAAKMAALAVDAPLTDWADGPGTELATEAANDSGDLEVSDEDVPTPGFSVTDEGDDAEEAYENEDGYEDEDGYDDADASLPVPSFGVDDDEDERPASGPSFGSLLKMPMQASKAPLELSGDPVERFEVSATYAFGGDGTDEGGAFGQSDYAEPSFGEVLDDSRDYAPTAGHAIELPEIDPADMGLGDWLAAAREMAAAARGSEDRTRDALYEAVGRAYDFSLAAAEAPEEFEEIVTDSGLTAQDRAPMTPVVKLVFGADYDKTRLTEYAAVLTHAHRLKLAQGSLGAFLREAEGGLKGVVKAERRLRKEEAGKVVEPVDSVRDALAKKLREIEPRAFDAIDADGAEFALVMIRRTETGAVVMLGEVPDEVALVERAARRLIG